ncbi:MAG: hypothetical protein J4G09_11940, partial [Proteobacteria bacterium]|nr:hypothetical protein [Pseudomonadota bacterium]
RVLKDVDPMLPEEIGALLKDEDPKNIYTTVVSSQFDADRLDYVQRDRMMTGVQYSHIDLDWLLDCIEVGSITVGEEELQEAPCLYLGPKGLKVAEEYLEARYRLHTMVYTHKTTRAAEKMLAELLRLSAINLADHESSKQVPILRYLTSNPPTLDIFLGLDDTVVWASLETLADSGDPVVS